MPVVLVLLLVALSVLVGWCGRNRAIGFAGFFVLSLMLTPFIMALVLVVSVPRHDCAPCPEAPKLPEPAPEPTRVDA